MSFLKPTMKLTTNIKIYCNRSQLVRQLVYIIFVTDNYAPFTCGERKKSAKYQKVQNIMTTIAGSEIKICGPWCFFQTKNKLF